jgi:hypothetical protein
MDKKHLNKTGRIWEMNENPNDTGKEQPLNARCWNTARERTEIRIREEQPFSMLRDPGNSRDNVFVEIATDYFVNICPGDRLILRMGLLGAGITRKDLQHPNILAIQDTVFEFKRDLPGGGKRWSEKPGRVAYLSVANKDVFLIPEEGHSYVPVRVAGE